MISLQKMVAEEEAEAEGRVIQNIGLYPKSVMLYSLETLNIFFDRCKEDIVYLDATGSIVRKGKGQMSPFYVYELVVRHPTKGSSPLPVATYITSDHTTASVSHFLGSVVTDLIKHHGRQAKSRPVMLICDGSVVLLHSLAYNFCGVSLQELLCRYFSVVTGQATNDAIGLPILHRCLSHIMKNAKELCRKQYVVSVYKYA